MTQADVVIGQLAPDFTLPASTGSGSLTLSSLRGKIVVLAFYILDFTGTWTNELQSLQANLARFEELNAQVLGISVDSVFSHRAYAEQLGVTFPLLADFHPKGKVSQLYGLWRDEWGTSRRAVIILDRDGVVQYSEVIAKGPPDVEVIVKAVQAIAWDDTFLEKMWL